MDTDLIVTADWGVKEEKLKREVLVCGAVSGIELNWILVTNLYR